MIEVGGSNPLWVALPWAGGPGWYTKAAWAGHAEQAREQHFSMVSAAVPVSRLLLEFSQWWNLMGDDKPNKHFLLQVGFDQNGLSQQEEAN